MAHLPRDGAGREKDEPGKPTGDGRLHAAEGASGAQLVRLRPARSPAGAPPLACLRQPENPTNPGIFERCVAGPFLAMSAPLSAGGFGRPSALGATAAVQGSISRPAP